MVQVFNWWIWSWFNITRFKFKKPTRALDGLYFPAIKDAEPDFTKESKPIQLVPIIFSHGLGASSSQYFGHLSELASHGYITFAMDHLDGSCLYTERKLYETEVEQIEPMKFDTSNKLFHYQSRNLQLQKRVDEV